MTNERLPTPMPLRKLLQPLDGIILNGRRYQVPGRRVLTWHEHGVQFRVGQGFNRRRRGDIELVVWHWTGAENPPLTMAKTLERRALGVEFAIDRDAYGTIYQFCDPFIVDTADAGPVNHRSVGIEVVNYGVRSWDRAWMVPARGADRVVEQQRIHGKPVSVAGFYDVQTKSARALAEVLSAVLEIPREVPLYADGTVDDHLFDDRRIENFQGHCGHLHVNKDKLDPGTRLLADLFDPQWELAA